MPSKDIEVSEYTFKRGTQAALRMRLGKAINNTLFYLAGGIAAERISVAVPIAEERQTMTGWNIGVGIDHSFNENWFGRVEVNYTDYGHKEFNSIRNTKIDLKETRASIGIAYKF